MELSCFNIEYFIKKAFFVLLEIQPCTFKPKLEKIKKSTTRKFLIFQETGTPKKNIYFSGNKNFLYFSRKFQSPKNQKKL